VADPWRFSVSVAAAVVREDGRMLAIQRRDNSQWEPPGGLVEPGETIHQTLAREVEEETGILVEAERLSGVYQNMSRDIVALVFRCRAAGGELRTSPESVAVDWLTPEEISERMDEAYAARLLDAARDGTAVRTHDGKHLLP
jgi:8-oxo-dGTP diphosphatase